MPLWSVNTRRALLSLSAAALLWGSLDNPAANAGLADPTNTKTTAAPKKKDKAAGRPQAAKSGSPAAGSRNNLRSVGAGNVFAVRQALYDQMSTVTGIPWFRFAAIDQYERTLTKKSKDGSSAPERLTGIHIPAPLWCGPLNPNQEDTSPATITFFGGIGRDGSGDGKADPENDLDALYTMARHLMKYGLSASDFGIGVWEYYHNPRASQRIAQFAKLYDHFGRLDLSGSAFPLPLGSTYSYNSTWGSGRSWGGARIHEGTDLFTPHGVTVRSTCYGIIETKGWNRFGGWRIGIRDIENRYHYYAHLSGFDKSLSAGDIVIPGQQLGWAGSSGYGKPGTQGKFPPHLHYGIYKDRGLTEWAFDPYPLLKQWENAERKALHKNKKGSFGKS
ncbi:M23 family metallopeptidase [Paenibacillus durus]|uniref:M23 family metallopeptidase n=1 Tax=Paenibacillus durus TaxID=44251 RepID=UPI0004712F13|nr:M23 family metallopeptidase [Paenibacillus durus]